MTSSYSTARVTVSIGSLVLIVRAGLWQKNDHQTGAGLNDKILPANFNYDSPPFPFIVNGKFDPTSQRLHVRFLFKDV